MSVIEYTQAEIDQLRAAITSGVLRVRYDGPPGREVTYHSLSEMRDLLAAMTSSVEGTSSAPTYRLAKTSKGL